MRSLPVPDPGTPDHRSATRYLLWLIRTQSRSIALGMLWGVLWMVSQALMPAAVGAAIDKGIVARDPSALLLWASALFGLGVVQATTGILRHRCAVFNWISAAYRTVQLTVRHAGHLGAALSKRVAAGEVVSVGTADISHIGNGLDVTARASGAVVALIAVTVILLSTSVPLGLVVIVGVPLLMAVVSLLIRPLHRRQHAYRDASGDLTTRASDIVTGLRVLRGIGGEATFAARYREESQRVRAAGVRVARVESVLEAAQLLLPGIFVALVTWLAARFVLRGDIEVGQLIAFYGYAVFLVVPIRTLTEATQKFTRAHVAAQRVVRLLDLQPDLDSAAAPAGARPSVAGDLIDPESGVVIRPGLLTAVSAAAPADALAIADRLGRYRDGAVTFGGVALSDLDRGTVRELILVADNEALIFSGGLRQELGGADDEATWAALHVASARDIVEALPERLDADVAERGREFSGGQQQRLRLARALLVDPPVLVLVEPTSAVDAHTEARIAGRLAEARAGRTTVVCTTSPLVLDRADHVIYVQDGRAVAEGTHRALLDRHPGYLATVTRGEDE